MKLENIVKQIEPNVKELVRDGYNYTIIINDKGVRLRRYKRLVKRKRSLFSEEQARKIRLFKTAVKEKTGVMYISSLLAELVGEMEKHHLAEFDRERAVLLAQMYNNVGVKLMEEIKSVGKINDKGRRSIRGPESA